MKLHINSQSISQEEFSNKYINHQLWLDSAEKEGSCADFSNIDLHAIIFPKNGTNLQKAIFRGANLQNIVISGANLQEANFETLLFGLNTHAGAIL